PSLSSLLARETELQRVETVTGEIKIKQRSGERINRRRNLLAALMASLRTAKQLSNWLQKRYVYGDGEMALPSRAISGVERTKTHKDYEGEGGERVTT
ncbi:hypothetical protein P5V15_002069, partial [Pogonomyrmex californicus]